MCSTLERTPPRTSSTLLRWGDSYGLATLFCVAAVSDTNQGARLSGETCLNRDDVFTASPLVPGAQQGAVKDVKHFAADVAKDTKHTAKVRNECGGRSRANMHVVSASD